MKEGRNRPPFRGRKPQFSAVLLGVLFAASSFAQTPQSGAQAPPPPPRPAGPGAPAQPPVMATNPVVQNTPPDKVVMKVGTQNVTAGQIQGVVKVLPIALQRSAAAQGLKVVGDQYSMLLLLSQQAATQGLDQTPDFKQKLDLQRMTWLAQDEYKKIADDVQVSQDDINKYFAGHQKDFEEVQVRQISVRKKPANAKPEAPGLAEADAQKRAEDIRKALMSGEDAKKVSDDFKMANVVFFDPNPRPVRHGQLPGEMDKTAWSLKDGEVSDIQKNPMNLYFIQVVKHEQPAVADVSKEIESKLKEEKLQNSIDTMKQQANIWLDPQYFAPPPGAKPEADEEQAAPKPQSQGTKAPSNAPKSQ